VTEGRLLSLLHSRAVAHELSVAGPEAVIARAAAAPFQDALRHDAGALCGDLVPRVAAEAAPSVGCTSAASRDFAAVAPNEPRGDACLSLTPAVQHLQVVGRHATLTLRFTFVTVTEKSGSPRPSSTPGDRSNSSWKKWVAFGSCRLRCGS